MPRENYNEYKANEEQARSKILEEALKYATDESEFMKGKEWVKVAYHDLNLGGIASSDDLRKKAEELTGLKLANLSTFKKADLVHIADFKFITIELIDNIAENIVKGAKLGLTTLAKGALDGAAEAVALGVIHFAYVSVLQMLNVKKEEISKKWRNDAPATKLSIALTYLDAGSDIKQILTGFME